jgi:hypothetical protein
MFGTDRVILVNNVFVEPLCSRRIPGAVYGNRHVPVGQCIIGDIALETNGETISVDNTNVIYTLEEWLISLSKLEHAKESCLTENFEPLAYMYREGDVLSLFWHKREENRDTSFIGTLSYQAICSSVDSAIAEIRGKFIGKL